MSQNDFLPFCPTDTGTNLLTESEYLAAADRVSGNKPGVASSKLNNRAMRQSTFVIAQLSQFISDSLGMDVLDDNNNDRFLAQIRAQFFKKAPIVTSLLSGSGTFGKTYSFKIVSGAATAAATYTNNGKTFTVKTTIAAGTVLEMTGTGDPSVSGILTKASGSGDATITFYAVQSALYLRVRCAGGGGGGGGFSTAGGVGGNTTFGTTLLVANGGTGGAQSGNGGIAAVGGTASLGTGPVGLAVSGGSGTGASNCQTNEGQAGGAGGNNAFGGGGGGGMGTNAGGSAGGTGITNTGGGGGGGGFNTGAAGGGGGAGGYVDAMITSPLATYAYVVGAAGSAGTGSPVGGAGGSGVILVEEYFQ